MFRLPSALAVKALPNYYSLFSPAINDFFRSMLLSSLIRQYVVVKSCHFVFVLIVLNTSHCSIQQLEAPGLIPLAVIGPIHLWFIILFSIQSRELQKINAAQCNIFVLDLLLFSVPPSSADHSAFGRYPFCWVVLFVFSYFHLAYRRYDVFGYTLCLFLTSCSTLLHSSMLQE